MDRFHGLRIVVSLFVFLWGLVSCSADLDEEVVNAMSSSVPLTIKVSNQPFSKARVSGNSMPDSARLGVFLRATDGSRYDNLTLKNLTYLATGGGNDQTWAAVNGQPFSLSRTVGVSYAYYPCTDTEWGDLKVPIRNDGTDWMYSSHPATNLSVENPVAQFEMVHAMALIRCRILRGNYGGAGSVTTVALSSASLAKEANMDLQAGSVTDFRGVGEEIALKNVGTLSSEPMEIEFWAVPTSIEDKLSFRLVVDGSQYKVSSSNIEVEAGVVYNYAITLEEKDLVIETVTLEEWNERETLKDINISSRWAWERLHDGVYAIDENGCPIPYEEASADTYAGAAFVANGKAYQVAKKDVINSDGVANVYWWKTGYKDIEELPNYSKLFANQNWGYLPKADGTTNGGSSHKINTDWTTWQHSGWVNSALTDFNGKENTEILVRLLGTTPNTIGWVAANFRDDPYLNEGYTDWFVPSCAQMACMAIVSVKLDKILNKVSGGMSFCRTTSIDYWTSTERSANEAMYIGLFDGGVNGQAKYNTRSKRCRMIREL